MPGIARRPASCREELCRPDGQGLSALQHCSAIGHGSLHDTLCQLDAKSRRTRQAQPCMKCPECRSHLLLRSGGLPVLLGGVCLCCSPVLPYRQPCGFRDPGSCWGVDLGRPERLTNQLHGVVHCSSLQYRAHAWHAGEMTTLLKACTDRSPQAGTAVMQGVDCGGVQACAGGVLHAVHRLPRCDAEEVHVIDHAVWFEAGSRTGVRAGKAHTCGQYVAAQRSAGAQVLDKRS